MHHHGTLRERAPLYPCVIYTGISMYPKHVVAEADTHRL